MKTPEEILLDYAIWSKDPEHTVIVKVERVIKAMEEYAIQSVDTACANAVVQMETLEDENRSHIDTVNGQEYRIMELEKEIEDLNKTVERLKNKIHIDGKLNPY